MWTWINWFSQVFFFHLFWKRTSGDKWHRLTDFYGPHALFVTEPSVSSTEENTHTCLRSFLVEVQLLFVPIYTISLFWSVAGVCCQWLMGLSVRPFTRTYETLATNCCNNPPQLFYHNRSTALFPGPPGWAGARRELLDFMVQARINRGKHTDHPARRHSIRTNQCRPPLTPLLQHSIKMKLCWVGTDSRWTI